MTWQDIRMRWEELDGTTRARLVAIIRQRLGVTGLDEEVSFETPAGAIPLEVELEELEIDLALEPIDEAARHPGRDDLHEQREDDQETEGVVHWPPHFGRLGRPWGMPGR